LIYLNLATVPRAFPDMGRRFERGATMQPWALHSLTWALTAIGLIAIASMLC